MINDMTIKKDEIKGIIISALKSLIKNDGELFGLQKERYDDGNNNEEIVRKLHEVCINHKLSNHLEKEFKQRKNSDLYFDIEFNREGENKKIVDGKLYRPDIILHNRKTGEEKKNILIIECKKKSGSSHTEIADDVDKIISFMIDEKYNYNYGLQVIYKDNGTINATLFFKDNTVIKDEKINV